MHCACAVLVPTIRDSQLAMCPNIYGVYKEAPARGAVYIYIYTSEFEHVYDSYVKYKMHVNAVLCGDRMCIINIRS